MVSLIFAIQKCLSPVVPGNINSINSIGTNDLIKQGARIITNYKEVLW